MILFDSFNKKEKMFLESMQCAHNDSLEALVLEDIPFLPSNVFSIYDYYLNEWDPHTTFKNIYYAFIDTPNFWKIIPQAERGAIYDKHEKKANIFVQSPVDKRLVEHVEWIKNNQVYRKDYYDRYGKVYKQEHLDENNKLLETCYITSTKKEIIKINHSNGIVGVLQKNNLMKYYHSKEDWFKDYLTKLCSSFENVVVTSNLQKEMLQSISYKDWSVLETKIDSLCYVSKDTIQKINDKKSTNNIFILTTSDQLEGIEEIVDALPRCNFHIGASTAFSNKIIELGKKENVHLYSTIQSHKINELFDLCPIYLDINKAHSYPNSVEAAALNGLIILGFEDTVRKTQYLLENYILPKRNISAMISKLQFMTSSRNDQIKIALIQRDQQLASFKEL